LVFDIHRVRLTEDDAAQLLSNLDLIHRERLNVANRNAENADADQRKAARQPSE
jgi:hypothetical protein